MSKLNSRKIVALGFIAIGVGVVGFSFQNFSPHDPFAGHDTQDLYMDDALTEALRQEKRNADKPSVAEPSAEEINPSLKEESQAARAPASEALPSSDTQ